MTVSKDIVVHDSSQVIRIIYISSEKYKLDHNVDYFRDNKTP